MSSILFGSFYYSISLQMCSCYSYIWYWHVLKQYIDVYLYLLKMEMS